MGYNICDLCGRSYDLCRCFIPSEPISASALNSEFERGYNRGYSAATEDHKRHVEEARRQGIREGQMQAYDKIYLESRPTFQQEMSFLPEYQTLRLTPAMKLCIEFDPDKYQYSLAVIRRMKPEDFYVQMYVNRAEMVKGPREDILHELCKYYLVAAKQNGV